MPITLPTLEESLVKNVSALSDTPSADGMAADTLKYKFDLNSINIQQFLNGAYSTALKTKIDALEVALIGTDRIENGAITTDKLYGAVGYEAVTTAKIRDGAITEDKLSSSPPAVTADKIAGGAVSTLYDDNLLDEDEWSATGAPFSGSFDAIGFVSGTETEFTCTDLDQEAIDAFDLMSFEVITNLIIVTSSSAVEVTVHITAVQGEETQSLTVTPSSLSANGPPYVQTVDITGITENDAPVIDMVLSGDWSDDEPATEAWGLIYRAVTGENTITFYASEDPAVDLSFSALCVRK